MKLLSCTLVLLCILSSGAIALPATKQADLPKASAFGFKLDCRSTGGYAELTRMTEPQCTVDRSEKTPLPGSKLIDASAVSEWRKISSNSQISVYIDNGSASRLSSLVSTWIKVVYKTAQASPHAKNRYVSSIGEGTYDCRRNTFSEGMRILYDARGNPIDLLAPTRPDLHLPSNSSIASSFVAICNRS